MHNDNRPGTHHLSGRLPAPVCEGSRARTEGPIRPVFRRLTGVRHSRTAS